MEQFMSTINQTHVFSSFKWSYRSSVQFRSSRDKALNGFFTSFETDMAQSMGMFTTDCSQFGIEEQIPRYHLIDLITLFSELYFRVHMLNSCFTYNNIFSINVMDIFLLFVKANHFLNRCESMKTKYLGVSLDT